MKWLFIMNANIYQIDDVLEFKKTHPCGSKNWKVLKTGVDYKLECCGCGRIILVPRTELKKKVKKLVENK